MCTNDVQRLCVMDRYQLNDHKRENIYKCFLSIPMATSQYILKNPCLESSEPTFAVWERNAAGGRLSTDTQVWTRNGTRSCPLLDADSGGVAGITPAHHSSAETRARSPRSLPHGAAGCQCGSPSKLVDPLLLSQTRTGFHGVAPIGHTHLSFARNLFSVQAQEQHCHESH